MTMQTSPFSMCHSGETKLYKQNQNRNKYMNDDKALPNILPSQQCHFHGLRNVILKHSNSITYCTDY